MNEWLNSEYDFASWSDSTTDSAIMGNVDECIEQLQVHIDAGVQKIIFVPYKYELEQTEVIAKEILPRLRR
jgi:alkanesulfonate monooxygenase